MPSKASPRRKCFARLGVEADFSHDGGEAAQMEWIHFAIPDGEMYFVAHQTEEPMTVECSFRVSGRQPELWDPMDGSRRTAVAFTQKDGRTIVPIRVRAQRLDLRAVSRRRSQPISQGKAESNFPAVGEPVEVRRPMDRQVRSRLGRPESVAFDTLTDWTEHAEPGIKYYSGIATYEKRFTLPERAE